MIVESSEPRPRADAGSVVNADIVESLWGVQARAKGGGSLGLSAALWNATRKPAHEIVRPACDLTYVISIWNKGSVTSELSLDDKTRFRRVRGRGTFQLARAGESVRAVLRHGSGTCLDLYLPARVLTTCLETECENVRGSLEVLPVGLESDPVITRLGDEIAAEIQAPGLASRMAMDSATLLLGVTLIRRWSNQSDQVRQPVGGLAPWQVSRAIAYIRDNLARDIPLAELAGVVRLSAFHFARAFKQSCGKPPHAFQYGLRAERAQALLIETDLSVTEIAGLVGYETPQSLARVFQRVVGVSPTAYRRQRRS